MTKSWSDIESLHSLYHQKKISPVEVTKWYLDRINKLNPKLNAFLTVTEESALKQAQELNNPDLPLYGVPIALKDLYMTQGIRTTAGSKVLENYVAHYNATVVQKYLEAGAILLGKLNCDAWAHGSSGENSDFGPTRNPWNLDYVPGGSSSGSGAAVAADLCMVAGGTDTGGSIRCPASFCSVTGLKPTYGRVSRYGIIAMASSLDSIGHLTGTVRDSARVLSVTAGHDINDASSAIHPLVKPNWRQDLNGLRVGVYMPDGVDEQTRQLVLSAMEKLRELGGELKEIELDYAKYALPSYYIIQPAEVSSNLARYDGIRFGQDRSCFGAEAKRRIMLGTYTLSSGYYDAYYNTAQKVRSLIVQDYIKAFGQFEVIVAPVMPHPAFRIGEKVADPLALYLEDVLTVPINLAGLPAISIPAGFTKEKLPVGIQIIGPQFSEALVFEVADAFQQATAWHHEHPSL